jgi:uncharacterized protein (DUF1800 family)
MSLQSPVGHKKMNQLSFADARHLVARTGLGVEWETIQRLAGEVNRKTAVEIILNSHSPVTPNLPRLTPVNQMENMIKKGARGKRLMHNVMTRENSVLKQWWVRHMLKTRTPLSERMTLFWHNHFTSSLGTVERPELLLRQNILLRKHSLGNFATLVKAISRDPAMLIYLDADKNIKGSPNENFARELLELFTLGIGHYSEADIKAAAIAFTGWGVNRQTGQFYYNAKLHDDQPVRFLGKYGKFKGDDIVKIILENQRTAEYIAERFWTAFINLERPNRNVTRQWANLFRQSGYETRVLLKAVLTSNEFWDEKNRGALIKSPIELMVGTLRSLPHYSLSAKDIMHTSRILGQDLFDPPNVKGWKGGKNWVTTQSLLIRTSLQHKMSRDDNIKRMAQFFPDVADETITEWLLPQAPVLAPAKRRGKLWFVQNLMFDPAYQLT